ncbi:DUF58 domain-containing protein [Paracrocinitomix mangrovi]|uniref:DUF58 domain-containing protein n=1 Tax=Paracrocinitomix mangrovi TaxID=2862509 RepID=UPI001EDC682B|nr:DUF58 domain-containing protein [Paracrocinitomix mangrovi]UKN01217.1 DUF58 domain-containing protein [Paracrocinitomix mangrovi]
MYGNIDIQELAKFGNLEFVAKQVVEGFITGMHRSPFHGFSVEFAEHRLYNTGESTKHIDWKLFAKTDKLFVKRYEEETNLRCRIILDVSSSMYFPEISNEYPLNKLGFSIYAIASLVEIFKKQRDGVGLTVFDEKIITDTAIKTSSSHHRRLYHELEQLMVGQKENLNKPTSLSSILHNVAENNHKRSLVIIFSDFFSKESMEDITDAFLHLKHNKHEVLLFNVIDKKHEVELDFPNRPTTFVDLETGEKVKLHPSEIKKSFQKQVAEINKELKLKCSQFKIDYMEADIREGVEFVLQQYLIKRGKII